MDEEAFFSDFLKAVEQQLISPQTAYVAKTLKRLVEGGLDEAEAKERIAECLAEEMDAMYRRRQGFDEKSYRARLNELTALPLVMEEAEPEETEPGQEDE